MNPFLVIILALGLSTSTALACGGEDLTDETILESQELTAVKTKIHDLYGQQVTITEIMRTGNQILNIDKVEVVSAMCAANYHHVYMATQESGNLRCLVMFEPGYPGQIKVDYNEIRASCSLDGGKEKLIKVPFKRMR